MNSGEVRGTDGTSVISPRPDMTGSDREIEDDEIRREKPQALYPLPAASIYVLALTYCKRFNLGDGKADASVTYVVRATRTIEPELQKLHNPISGFSSECSSLLPRLSSRPVRDQFSGF